MWHPFTQMQGWLADEPLVIERAEGSWLVDTEGRRYLDGVSSLWVNVHGHRRKEIDDAIRAQLDRVAHTTLLGLASTPSIELAERLVSIAPPGLAKVFYSDSGSTAVEVGLKIAFQYWRQRDRPEKRRFVTLAEAYHGDTIGAVSLGGIDLFHGIFGPLLFDTLRAPTPYPYRDPAGGGPAATRDRCLAALESILRERGREIAAVVMEPLVQGAAGMIVHPAGFLAGVAALCKEHDVLLVCDEVATGFGRTGTMFACEQEEVTPDILCLAKGITGGYLPLAATLATDAVYEAFLGPHESQRTFFHGHTYTGNPLACAAAMASLDLFERDRLLERVRVAAKLLAAELALWVSPLPHVGEIRQRGLMAGIELARDRETREEYTYAEAIGARVCRAARPRGVILRPLGSVVVLMPPLRITDEELRLLARITAESIAEVTGA